MYLERLHERLYGKNYYRMQITRGPLGRPTDMALGSRKNENSFVTKRGREKERAPFFGGGNSVTQKRFCTQVTLMRHKYVLCCRQSGTQ